MDLICNRACPCKESTEEDWKRNMTTEAEVWNPPDTSQGRPQSPAAGRSKKPLAKGLTWNSALVGALTFGTSSMDFVLLESTWSSCRWVGYKEEKFLLLTLLHSTVLHNRLRASGTQPQKGDTALIASAQGGWTQSPENLDKRGNSNLWHQLSWTHRDYPGRWISDYVLSMQIRLPVTTQRVFCQHFGSYALPVEKSRKSV